MPMPNPTAGQQARARLNVKEAMKKKSILNPDLSRSSERTITIGDKATGFVNIPTVISGKQLSVKEAIKRSKKAKVKGRKRYKTLKEAVRDAGMRSQALGRVSRGIP